MWAILAFLVLLIPTQANALACAGTGECDNGNRRFPLVEGGDTLYFIHFANHDLFTYNPEIDTVWIHIHGTGPQLAQGEAVAAVDLLQSLGIDDTVAFIGPQFTRPSRLEGDGYSDENGNEVNPGVKLALGTTDADVVYWDNGNWLECELSEDEVTNLPDEDFSGYDTSVRAFDISACEVLNRILERAAITWPNVRQVIITGHSAGGQMVNRYAFAASDAGTYWPGVVPTFKPMNPSSVAYLSSDRPIRQNEAVTFGANSAKFCTATFTATTGTRTFSGFTVGSATTAIASGQDFTAEYANKIMQFDVIDRDAIGGKAALFADLATDVQLTEEFDIGDDYTLAQISFYPWSSLPSNVTTDSNVTIIAKITEAATDDGGGLAPRLDNAYVSDLTAGWDGDNSSSWKYELKDDGAGGIEDDDAGTADAWMSETITYDEALANFSRYNYHTIIEITDRSAKEGSIAQDCNNTPQGMQRLERAEFYLTHMIEELGWDRVVSGQTKLNYTIHGGAHGGSEIIGSDCGPYAILGLNPEACTMVPDEAGLDEPGDEDAWTLNSGSILTDASRRAFYASANSFWFPEDTVITSPDYGSGVFMVAFAGWIPNRSTGAIVVEYNADGAGWVEIATLDSADGTNQWLYQGVDAVPADTSFQVRVSGDAGTLLDGLRVIQRFGLMNRPPAA